MMVRLIRRVFKIPVYANYNKIERLTPPLREQYYQGIIKDLVAAMKQVMELLNTNEIIVIGSLNPQKTVQDRVRVLDAGGGMSSIESNRLQGPSENSGSWKRVDAVTTRLQNIASTIRASLYKQGERNILKNIEDGNGYEGIIEIWRLDNSSRNN